MVTKAGGIVPGEKAQGQHAGPLRIRSREALLVLMKGMAMGIAEVVPGVSGGTVAYITGIYERLLRAINACSFETLRILRIDGLTASWNHLDGSFLVFLFGGMAISVITLAHGMSFLLHNHPIAVWAFFFGIIIASSCFMVVEINDWAPLSLIALLAGVCTGVVISSAIPVELEGTLPIIFVAGAFAVCAWILPGVSGSYILLILGLYATVMDAISNMDLLLLGVLAAGCVTGLLGFSRLLVRLLAQHRDATLALLTGFMLGSLVKVWPWKYTLSYQIGASGTRIPLQQEVVLPNAYQQLTGGDPQMGLALLLGASGICMVAAFAIWPRGRARADR